MTAFSSRTGGYKAGVCLLFFATAVFLVGFGAPYWATVDHLQLGDYTISFFVTYEQGLWMACIKAEISTSYSAIGCGVFVLSSLPGWFHAVRALLTLCTAGLVIACIYILATNCFRSIPGPHSRVAEIVTGFSGLLGFTGCMVYVGVMIKEDAGNLPGVHSYMINSLAPSEWSFNWAFYLAAVGSGLTFIAALVIGIGNKPVGEVPHAEGMVMSTISTQPGYAPQPYVAQRGYAPQPYVIQPGYAAQPYAAQPGRGPQPNPAQPGYEPAKVGYPAS